MRWPRDLDPFERTLAENIRRVRRMRKLTQRQLAEATDLKRSDVARIESGRQTLDVRTLVAIAAALQVRVRMLAIEPKDEA